jgi:WhiB family redox-sensing transcriptional regulator
MESPTLEYVEQLYVTLSASWQMRAVCHDDDGWYVNPGNRNQAGKHQEAFITRCCKRCPVTDECLQLGLNEPIGVWGGLTRKDRVELLKSRAR